MTNIEALKNLISGSCKTAYFQTYNGDYDVTYYVTLPFSSISNFAIFVDCTISNWLSGGIEIHVGNGTTRKSKIHVPYDLVSAGGGSYNGYAGKYSTLIIGTKIDSDTFLICSEGTGPTGTISSPGLYASFVPIFTKSISISGSNSIIFYASNGRYGMTLNGCAIYS